MSIAVLRAFVAKRKEEHEAMANKRNKSHQENKQSETSVQNGEDASTSQLDEMDVVPEKDLNQAQATKTPSWKVTRELKPPLVLEVTHLILWKCSIYMLQFNNLTLTDI